MLLSSLFDGSGKCEEPSPLHTEEVPGVGWGDSKEERTSPSPPALSSAEMAASWGRVLHLNQIGDFLSHPGQFQDAKVVLSGYLPVD